MPNPELLTVTTAAEFLGTTEKALRARVDRKQIPFRKWRGKIVFIRGELEEYFHSLPGCSLEEALRNEDRQ